MSIQQEIIIWTRTKVEYCDSHLKLGMASNFSGMGPENRLFSIFLFRKRYKYKPSGQVYSVYSYSKKEI